MARILENLTGRRTIQVSTDDIISIVREYQRISGTERNYENIRKLLDRNNIFIAED
ncbi:hypothetical protein IJ818_03545 [bacterium]|nr:hypothetical protein [bacterium]